MEAVIFEIFSNLPAKSIFKYGVVSKQCYQLLTDNFFAEKQSRNLKDQEDSRFFIQPISSQRHAPNYLRLESVSLLDKISSGIPRMSIDFLSKTGPVLASSNGLLCCRNIHNAEYPLFLCNPVNKTWLPIIKPMNDFDNQNHDLDIVLVRNIDQHLNSDKYVLMAMVPHSDWGSIGSRLCKIYSPKKRVWEELGEIMVGSRSIKYDMPVYLNNDGGTLYFLSDWYCYLTRNSSFYWPYIVSYNIKKSVSQFLKIPKAARRGIMHDDQNCKLGIFKFKHPKTCTESICLVKSMKQVFSIWMLVDAESSKWKMILKSRIKAMGLTDYQSTIYGFTVINGNLLLIATDDEIYKYNLSEDLIRSTNDMKKTVKISKYQDERCGVCFYSYSNTLRPCGDGAVPMPENITKNAQVNMGGKYLAKEQGKQVVYNVICLGFYSALICISFLLFKYYMTM